MSYESSIRDVDEYLRIIGGSTEEHSHANQPQAGSIPCGYFPADPNQAIQYQPVTNTHSYPPSQTHLTAQGQALGTPLREYDIHNIQNELTPDGSRANPPEKGLQNKRAPKRKAAASPENDHPNSKRAEKRAKMMKEYGSVGATDKPKGIFRTANGTKEWYDHELKLWRLAAPLDDYRSQIIADDNARGMYDHMPDCGKGDDDITTFPINDILGQRYWNFDDRSRLGNIRDEAGNEVMYLVDQPDTNNPRPSPGFMMYNNVIMLDPDNHPIIDWPNIPRCLSSNIEGGRLEAFRKIYPWIALPHFRARMPRNILKKSAGWKPLFGLSSLSQRLGRFREGMDMPAWKRTHAAKGADLRQHTVARLAEAGLGTTSTAALQPLSRTEILQRKEGYKGKFPENVGYYTLTEEERREKAEREASRHQEKQAKKRARDPRELCANGRESAEAVVSAKSLSGTKRRREESAVHEIHPEVSQKRQRLLPAPTTTPNSHSSSLRHFSSSTTRSRPHQSSQRSRPRLLPNSAGYDDEQRRAQEFVNPRHSASDYSSQRSRPELLPSPADLDDGRSRDFTINPNHPTSASSSQPQNTDLRHVTPKTLFEQLSIKTALSYTISDYQNFNGEAPPPTPNNESYNSQYQRIQAHHRECWYLPGDVPQLIGIPEWHGSFGSVPVPDLDERSMKRLLPQVDDRMTSVPEATTTAEAEAPLWTEKRLLPQPDNQAPLLPEATATPAAEPPPWTAFNEEAFDEFLRQNPIDIPDHISEGFGEIGESTAPSPTSHVGNNDEMTQGSTDNIPAALQGWFEDTFDDDDFI